MKIMGYKRKLIRNGEEFCINFEIALKAKSLYEKVKKFQYITVFPFFHG
jgi:hypothetical protein